MTNEEFEKLVGEGIDSIDERFLQKLKNVEIVIEDNPTSFPCAIMDVEDGMKQEDVASQTKIFTTNIIVRVLIRQKNAEAATLSRLSIIDDILEAFTTKENIDDLDGVADMADVVSVSPMFVMSNSTQPLFGFDVIISAKKLMHAT